MATPSMKDRMNVSAAASPDAAGRGERVQEFSAAITNLTSTAMSTSGRSEPSRTPDSYSSTQLATKARKGINPFTGEEMMFKAKPARNVVKATPLKALKDMV